MFEAAYISTPSYPPLDAEFAKKYLNLSKRIKIQDHIKKRNLEFKSDDSQQFFKSLERSIQIQKKFHLKPKETDLLLAWAVATQNTMQIRLPNIPDDFENTNSTITRNIFVSLEPSALEFLYVYSQTLLEKEYLLLYPELVNKKMIPELAVEKIKNDANTNLEIYLRYNDSIKKARDYYLQYPILEEDKEAIEKDILVSIYRFYNISDTGSVVTKQIIQKPAQDSSRRALDSQEWKKYESNQAQKGILNWHRSFAHLGPYFTSRIMLRKELFLELEECVVQYELWKEGEPRKVYDDVVKTIEALKNKGYNTGKLQALVNIKIKLQLLFN